MVKKYSTIRWNSLPNATKLTYLHHPCALQHIVANHSQFSYFLPSELPMHMTLRCVQKLLFWLSLLLFWIWDFLFCSPMMYTSFPPPLLTPLRRPSDEVTCCCKLIQRYGLVMLQWSKTTAILSTVQTKSASSALLMQNFLCYTLFLTVTHFFYFNLHVANLLLNSVILNNSFVLYTKYWK